ncbi:MAG: hypothetical protein M3Y59_01835 [Myxococcota bacterium]|nr:hypothetical protein [Myxococcota bacterium]
MESLKSDDLTIAVSLLASGDYLLDWTGKSNARDPAKVLIPFFDQVLQKAAGQKVEMHFERLEHFNSSTIATLIHLINSASHSGVPLRIFYDPNLRWQSLSFDALKRALRPFGTESRIEFVHAP